MTLGINIGAVFVVDHFPRNAYMAVGVLGSMATLILEAALVANFVPSHNQAALQAAVAMLFIFQIFYGGCCDGTQFAYLGELFPTHMRAKGVCLGVAMISFMNIIWLQAAPTAFQYVLSSHSLFLSSSSSSSSLKLKLKLITQQQQRQQKSNTPPPLGTSAGSSTSRSSSPAPSVASACGSSGPTRGVSRSRRSRPSSGTRRTWPSTRPRSRSITIRTRWSWVVGRMRRRRRSSTWRSRTLGGFVTNVRSWFLWGMEVFEECLGYFDYSRESALLVRL